MNIGQNAMTNFENLSVERARNQAERVTLPQGARVVPRNNINKSDPLYKAAQDFEAIFIGQMLDTMRSTVQKNGLLDGGQAEEIFEDMLYEERAKMMSQNSGFGLADMMYRQLSQDQAAVASIPMAQQTIES